MSDPILLRADANGIATLTLNTPQSLNALSTAMIAALTDALGAVGQEPNIRVVVLKGAGKAFCAGHDLKEMQAARAAFDKGQAYFEQLFQACAKMMLTLQNLPQPVIAQVHGIATAGGCQLAASCDLVTAAAGSRFGVNGVNIGLFCSTPMVALTRKIPRAVAFEMLTTGAFISAERAVEIGLANRVCPLETLDAQTKELAQTIAGKLTAAVKIGKRLFYDQADLPIAAAYDLAGRAMVENMLLRDTDEGITAFLEKRPPDWH